MKMRVTGMNAKGLLRSAVLGGVSTLAIVAIAGPSMAQTTTAAPAAKDDSTVVVVTGIRGSLQRSMNIKKNADGVVDGISAEDVGKYPDTNLADSLQRVTGVSINRVNGEGEQVTVRGFGPGYNSTTVDGRIMPATSIGVIGGGQNADEASGNTRAFDFSNIASDGVQAVQVYKTGRADVDSGGIGATINVQTLQPLAHPGQQGSITIKALTNDNPGLGTVLPKKSVTPEISGAYQWTNDSGKFGIAAFGSYQEKTGSNREDTVNTWTIEPYNTPGATGSLLTSGSYQAGVTAITNAPSNASQLVAIPTDSRIGYSELDTKRTNGQVVLQWKPTEALTVTANSFYAQTKQEEARSELTNWFSQSPFAALTFDGNSTIDSAVVVTDKVPKGKDQGYENEMRALNSDILSNGLNFKFHPNDNWTFTADLSSSKSNTGGGNTNGTSSTTVSVAQEYVGTDTTTYGSLQAPMQNVTMDLSQSPTGKQDIASISSGYSNEIWSKQSDKIDQAKFDATYQVDDSSKLSFGLDAYKNINEEEYNETTARFGDWGGLNPGDLLQYGNTPIKTFCLSCEFKTVNLDPDANLAYRFNAVPAFAGLAAYYSNVAGFKNVMASGTAAPLAPYANGFSHNKVEEDVKAGYAQFAMKADFLSRPVKILAGVRYEDTNVTVTAFQNIPTNIRWDQKNNFSIVQGSSVQPYAVKSHYSNLLPSLDMAMNVTDQIIGRMSFSVTDARPQYSQMYATTSVNAPGNPSYLNGIATASSGNPALKPLVSENFDVSGEWYYGKNSYVSLGYYRKAVQNFVGNGTSQTTLFGLTDPGSGKAGTRSGAAVTELTTLGQPVNTNTMSAMTVLIDQAGGNVATAATEYNTLTAPDGHVSTSLDALETYLWAHWPVVSNSTDPLMNFTLSQPVNNHTANIDGFEFAVQHFFGETGFGISASATTVNGDVALNNAYSPTNPTGQFALEGLSNTYNITGIYEKYGWSARLVYNWRDKYLMQANASQNGGRYAAAYGQWDGTVNYELTPKVTLSLEALNINKGHVVQYIRVPTDVVLYQELDTRYELGLRYKF